MLGLKTTTFSCSPHGEAGRGPGKQPNAFCHSVIYEQQIFFISSSSQELSIWQPLDVPKPIKN